MQHVTLKVEGMSCEHCVNSIEKALNELGAGAKVDLAAHKVNVDFDEAKITLEQIVETIEKTGYDVVS